MATGTNGIITIDEARAKGINVPVGITGNRCPIKYELITWNANPVPLVTENYSDTQCCRDIHVLQGLFTYYYSMYIDLYCQNADNYDYMELELSRWNEACDPLVSGEDTNNGWASFGVCESNNIKYFEQFEKLNGNGLINTNIYNQYQIDFGNGGSQRYCWLRINVYPGNELRLNFSGSSWNIDRMSLPNDSIRLIFSISKAFTSTKQNLRPKRNFHCRGRIPRLNNSDYMYGSGYFYQDSVTTYNPIQVNRSLGGSNYSGYNFDLSVPNSVIPLTNMYAQVGPSNCGSSSNYNTYFTAYQN